MRITTAFLEPSKNVTAYCSLALVQPIKTIMHFEDHGLAKILESYKELGKSCSFHLLYSPPGGDEEYFNDQVVPSHGGWIKVRSLLETSL